MVKLGAWIAGGGASREERVKDDFYATPKECTEALLNAEKTYLTRFDKIWEPACGDGAICSLLSERNIPYIATDLIDRGFILMDSEQDFLLQEIKLADAMITNPPFVLAEEFVRHAIKLNIKYVALLLKATFWHADKRRKLWNFWPPARIYAMTWRPDFRNWGSPTMDCIWCVWDENVATSTYSLLSKSKVL